MLPFQQKREGVARGLGESAGVKFNDVDLLGLPVRVVISPRNLANGVVELKRRRDPDSAQITPTELPAALAAALAQDAL